MTHWKWCRWNLCLAAAPATPLLPAAMGFAEGWGKALDQLIAHMKK